MVVQVALFLHETLILRRSQTTRAKLQPKSIKASKWSQEGQWLTLLSRPGCPLQSKELQEADLLAEESQVSKTQALQKGESLSHLSVDFD